MGYTALQFHGREMTVQFEYQVLDSLMFDRRRKDLGGATERTLDAKVGKWLPRAAYNQTFVLMRQAAEAPKRRTRAPAEAAKDPARVVKDGNIITAGGVTSGIDFGLSRGSGDRRRVGR